MKTRDVRVWKIHVNTLAGNKKSYTVRWGVGGKPQSKTFSKRALAENHRSDLMQAQIRGELFDTETGLPDSMTPAPEAVTWLTFVEAYLTMKWPAAAAKSRTSLVEALATVTPVLVSDIPGRPGIESLRAALRDFVLPPTVRQLQPPPDMAAAIAWIRKASLPLSAVVEPGTVRAALDELALRMDGKPAAATTMRRKRSVFYNVLQYAVELEKIDFNPIDKVRVPARRKKVVNEVDRRVVVNPRQARELLVAVTYVGRRGRGARLRAFFACLYFGALRPGEALGLRERDCYLPAKCLDCGTDVTEIRVRSSGCDHERVECVWGLLTLEKSRPQAGKRWTDSGEAHDERGLKHRGDDQPREVPIPPELVLILREHLVVYGAGPGGRLFRSERGNVVGASTYSRVWEETRRLAFMPRQVDSLLAGRPYDLRHAAVSLWLNAGVQAPEVAERAGHSVDVLLKVYAKCIDGQRDLINQRIEAALAG